MSLRDLRRSDPASWTRLTRIFPGLDVPEAEDGDELAHVVAAYHARLEPKIRLAAGMLERQWSGDHAWWIDYACGRLDHAPRPASAVEAQLGIGLLAIRHLDCRIFTVPFYLPLQRQSAICAHELFHFLYFDWLSGHAPDITPAQRNAPADPWRVSEIIVSVIMRDDEAERRWGPGPNRCYACPDEMFADALAAWRAHRAKGMPFPHYYRSVAQMVSAM